MIQKSPAAPKAAALLKLPTSRAPTPEERASQTRELFKGSLVVSANDTEPESVALATGKSEAQDEHVASVDVVEVNVAEAGVQATRRGRPKGSKNRNTFQESGDAIDDDVPRAKVRERVSHTIRFEPEIKRALRIAAFNRGTEGRPFANQDAIVNEATRIWLTKEGHLGEQDPTQVE